MDKWATETCYGNYRSSCKVKKVLFSQQSKFQKVEIVETYTFGRALLHDDVFMLTEKDEFIYHDMIAHVPLFVHPNPKKVLIIGGGDGGTAREVLRHQSVEFCVMVEIDEVVVNACKEFIPQTAACLSDSRLDLRIEDGLAFVKNTEEKFDVVIVDSSDPIGPATPLFGEEFYRNVAKILNSNGIVISQAESLFIFSEEQGSLMKVLSSVFSKRWVYNYVNAIYPGGAYSFSFATNSDIHPIQSVDSERIGQSALKFSYYSEAMHKAAFVLPPFQVEKIIWIN